MRSLKKGAALALAISAAVVGTAVAQDQSTQQGTSPGWTWGPRGMMGYGFLASSADLRRALRSHAHHTIRDGPTSLHGQP